MLSSLGPAACPGPDEPSTIASGWWHYWMTLGFWADREPGPTLSAPHTTLCFARIPRLQRDVWGHYLDSGPEASACRRSGEGSGQMLNLFPHSASGRLPAIGLLCIRPLWSTLPLRAETNTNKQKTQLKTTKTKDFLVTAEWCQSKEFGKGEGQDRASYSRRLSFLFPFPPSFPSFLPSCLPP